MQKEGRDTRKYTHKHVKVRHRFRIEMDLEGSGGGSLSPPLSMNNNNNNGKGGGADTTLSTDNDAKEIHPIIPPSRPMHAAMSNPFVDGTGGGGNDNEYVAAPGASMQNSVYTTRRFAQRATDSSSTINQHQQQQQQNQQNAEKGGGKNTQNNRAKPSISAADSNGTRGNTNDENTDDDEDNDKDGDGDNEDKANDNNNKKNKARTTRSSGSLHSEEVEGGGAPKAGSLNGTEDANTDGRPEVESKEKKAVRQQRRQRHVGSTNNNNNEDGMDTSEEAAAVVNETAPLPPTSEYEYKEPWDIPSAELIPAARSLKLTADAYQNEGRFDNAERTYGMALRFIEHESLFASNPVDENVEKQITDAKGSNPDLQLVSKSELTVACLIEASVCALKRGDPSRAGDLASRALNNSKNNTSALKARAQARLAEGDFQNALADCDEALKIEEQADTKADFELLRKEIETRSEQLLPMRGKQQQHEFDYGIQNAAVVRNAFAANDAAGNEAPVGMNATTVRTTTWQAEVEGESEGGRNTMDTEPGAAFGGIVREKITEGYDRDHGQTLLNADVEKKSNPNGTAGATTEVGDTTAQLNKTHLPTQQTTTHEQPLRSQDGGIQGSLLIGSVGGGGGNRRPRMSLDSDEVQAVLISNSTQRALGGTYSIQKDHRPTDALVESYESDEEGEEVCGGK